jgi:hypothetical protein
MSESRVQLGDPRNEFTQERQAPAWIGAINGRIIAAGCSWISIQYHIKHRGELWLFERNPLAM